MSEPAKVREPAPSGRERGWWWRSLSRSQRSVLAVTMLFWAFDGYETFALITTGPASLQALLPASELPSLSRYFGYLLAISLAGWTIGGIAGGFAGDRIGRRKTMIGAVLLYGIFTGFSALSPSWEVLALTRLLTGLGIGAEWAVGTALLQEVLPASARTKGAGLLQGTFSAGGLLVSLIWVIFNSGGGVSWRWVYVIGVLPAFLVVLLRKRIPESDRWRSHRRALTRQVLKELVGPALRGRMILALLVSLAITVGFWGSSSYLPVFVGSLAPDRMSFYTGWASALYNAGEIVGCTMFAYWAERWGRKPAAIGYLLGALVIVPIVFLTIHNAGAAVMLQLIAGYAGGGVFSWYTVHTPELFPTAVRASAIGAIFNVTRSLACVGALLTGTVAAALGGVGYAAAAAAGVYLLGVFAVLGLRETKGLPLPD